MTGVQTCALPISQKLTLDADDARFDEILQKVVAAAKKIEPDCELHL